MPTLRLALPDQGEVLHEFTAARITIGRRPDNTIQISDRSVSAHHAELIEEDGHYRLHDLGSTNLSFVDGEAVTDFHLHHACKIAFGTVHGEFDPFGGSAESRLSAAQLEKDIGFLRGENSELLGKIEVLQRQVDILSSARLVTKKADTTPFAAHTVSLKAVVSERDDLRHLTSGLKFELENVRNELAETARERDAARQACELLQAEKATQRRELQELRKLSASPAVATGPVVARVLPAEPVIAAGLTVIEETQPPERPVSPAARPPSAQSAVVLTKSHASTQRITLPLPPQFEPVFQALQPVQSTLARLAANPSETHALAELATYASQFVDSTAALGDHPLSRLGLSIEAMLHDFASRSEPPAPAHIHTLTQATEVIARLLDPRHLNAAQGLAQPRVLAVDHDAAELQSLTASLELAHLPTVTCADGNAVQGLVEKNDFDLLLLDVSLPGFDSSHLCSRIRENDRHRRSPVIFLTGTNTKNNFAQASLSRANDFLPKPFNTAELTVKAETWIWKNRFGLT